MDKHVDVNFIFVIDLFKFLFIVTNVMSKFLLIDQKKVVFVYEYLEFMLVYVAHLLTFHHVVSNFE